MPSGRRPTGNGTKRQCREMAELMRDDPTIGVRINGSIYSVKGQTGRYLIVQKMTDGNPPRYEVSTVYVTDFIDMIYNGGHNKDVKVVRA